MHTFTYIKGQKAVNCPTFSIYSYLNCTLIFVQFTTGGNANTSCKFNPLGFKCTNMQKTHSQAWYFILKAVFILHRALTLHIRKSYKVNWKLLKGHQGKDYQSRPKCLGLPRLLPLLLKTFFLLDTLFKMLTSFFICHSVHIYTYEL